MIEQKLNQQSTLPHKIERDLNYTSEPEQSVLSLTDADYEFLFNQLLEGVAHGWHPVKIDKFFQRLGERGEPKLWIEWLERYQTKITTDSNAYQQQLAARMMRFGEITRPMISVRQIGSIAYSIGREILQKKNVDLIWEYNGSDLLQTTPSTTSEQEEEKPATTENQTEKVESNTPDADSFNAAANWIQEALAEFVELAEQVGGKSEAEDKSKTQTSTETKAEETEQQSDSLSVTTATATQEKENLVESESNLTKADNNQISVAENENNLDLSWQEFTQIIETDERLAEQIAQKLNLTARDPQSIISAITERINQQESVEIDESTLELIESWFNLGLKQASAGDLPEAVTSWDKALELNPNLAEAWHNRGSALGRMGNYQQALESFAQALKIDPQNDHAWNDRAHTFYQLQQWSEALASWERAISIVPSNHQLWYNRGCTLEQLQQDVQALASYEKALEIKPDFILAKTRYASLLANQNPRN